MPKNSKTISLKVPVLLDDAAGGVVQVKIRASLDLTNPTLTFYEGEYVELYKLTHTKSGATKRVNLQWLENNLEPEDFKVIGEAFANVQDVVVSDD